MAQAVAAIFLEHSIGKLKQMTGYIEVCLSRLDQDQIWRNGHDGQNSIGNLVLHLCGNVRQWIGWSIGGLPDIRDRESEFSHASKMSTAGLVSMLDRVTAEAIAILENLPPERLAEEVPTQDGERSILAVIYQVVGHFQQHSGQIIFATKQLTGEDLNFYSPPKKSS